MKQERIDKVLKFCESYREEGNEIQVFFYETDFVIYENGHYRAQWFARKLEHKSRAGRYPGKRSVHYERIE